MISIITLLSGSSRKAASAVRLPVASQVYRCRVTERSSAGSPIRFQNPPTANTKATSRARQATVPENFFDLPVGSPRNTPSPLIRKPTRGANGITQLYWRKNGISSPHVVDGAGVDGVEVTENHQA